MLPTLRNQPSKGSLSAVGRLLRPTVRAIVRRLLGGIVGLVYATRGAVCRRESVRPQRREGCLPGRFGEVVVESELERAPILYGRPGRGRWCGVGRARDIAHRRESLRAIAWRHLRVRSGQDCVAPGWHSPVSPALLA